jgi:integrase
MPVDDLWYLKRRGADGERVPSQRHGRGKRWRVRWVDDQGAARAALFDRRSDADRHDVEMRGSVHRGQYIDPARGKVSVADYAAQWRRQQLHDPATAERVERAFRLHVLPVLGGMQLGQVRPSHVQGWVKGRSGVLAPSTLRVVYSYLVSMFGAAVLDRVVGSSPCQGIKLPEVERRDRFIPTAEQVHAMAAALPGRYAATVYVAAGCGLRQGEAWGLELAHVDFLRREVRVVQQLKVTAERTRPFLAPVKTSTSRRTVELGQVVAEQLSEHIRRFPPTEVEIDDETDPRRPVRRTARLLFTNAAGKPISRNGWSHTWRPAVRRAGLPEEFTCHTLRHYFATLLIHAGASVKTVQLALGHSTPTVTLNTYVGEWPDQVDRTRNLVDAALGGAAGTPGLAVAR